MKKLNQVKIIAEIGPNHNGDFNLAKKILTNLSKSKPDYVKFQLGDPYKIYSQNAIFAKYQKNRKFRGPVKMSLKNQLSKNQHLYLNEMCKDLDLRYSCTAFDLDSLIFLDKKINIPFFKIASGEIHSLDMLHYISLSKKPVILSTGMASINDITKSLKILKKNKKSRKITLLHCVSSYPTELKDMNLIRMKNLKNKFGLDVGLSDHSVSFVPAIIAVTNKATVIEKHVTFSKKLSGPDHKASLDIYQFSDFIKYIREAEILINSKLIKNSRDELNVKKVSRKSIVSSNFIPKGKKISEIDICFKRPGYGISPLDIKKVIGKRTLKNIKENSLIFKKDLI
jgi:N,N'-diacetyllegionaminate synthase